MNDQDTAGWESANKLADHAAEAYKSFGCMRGKVRSINPTILELHFSNHHEAEIFVESREIEPSKWIIDPNNRLVALNASTEIAKPSSQSSGMSQGLCPTCGAVTNFSAGQSEVKCTYCGMASIKQEQAKNELKQGKNSKAGGLLLLADSAKEGGNYDEAIVYYNKAIELDPNYVYAWLNKGACIALQSLTDNQRTQYGDAFKAAKSAWETAIQLGKNSPPSKRKVAELILAVTEMLSQNISATRKLDDSKHDGHWSRKDEENFEKKYKVNGTAFHDNWIHLIGWIAELISTDADVLERARNLLFTAHLSSKDRFAIDEENKYEEVLNKLDKARIKADPALADKKIRDMNEFRKAVETIHALVRSGQKTQAEEYALAFLRKSKPDFNSNDLRQPDGKINPGCTCYEFYFDVNWETGEILFDKRVRESIEEIRYSFMEISLELLVSTIQVEYGYDSIDEVKQFLKKEFQFDHDNPQATEPAKKSEDTAKKGCFIATACYGNYDHPSVIELRHFRDNCLEASTAGQSFVRWYYQWSPAFASFVAKSKTLKTLARVLIVTPALIMARSFNKNAQNNHANNKA